jgi:hypothetical protein
VLRLPIAATSVRGRSPSPEARSAPPGVGPGGRPALRRRQLEHRIGGRAPKDPARRDRSPQVDHPPVFVEEHDIEREAHAEGVDASAAWDQQPLARALTVEERQAEEPAPTCRGDGHRTAEDLGAGEASEAGWLGHAILSVRRGSLSPPTEFWKIRSAMRTRIVQDS